VGAVDINNRLSSEKCKEYNRILREVDRDNNKLEDYFEQQLEISQNDNCNIEINAIVRLDTRVGQKHIEFLQDLNVNIKHSFHIINAIAISFQAYLLQKLTSIPNLQIIYENQELVPMLKSAIPAIETDQNSLGPAGYPWIDGSGVTIAILELDGIDGKHSTFPPGKIIAYKDFDNNEDDLDPTDGMNTSFTLDEHGTMTASCAVGTGGDTPNIGAAPGANLVFVRLGGVESSSFLEGLEWCIDHKNYDFNKDGEADGPDIISMSMGSHIMRQISKEDFKDMCDAVRKAGIILVTSAGNEGPLPGTVAHPASFENVVAVGSINDDLTISTFSSRGPGENGAIKPNVCAPGEDITCAVPGGGWKTVDGTSFACPIVAGIIAMILQLKPGLSPDQVQSLLQDNAEDAGISGPDNTYGYGIVDTIEVLQNITSNPPYQSFPPKASFTHSPKSPTIDDAIQFTDSSMNSDGHIESWTWDFGDGTSSENQNPTKRYINSGKYKVTLTVMDNKNMTDTISQSISVKFSPDDPPPNEPPTIKITNPKNGDTINGTIEIKGTSSDGDGDVEQVEIQIGKGIWQNVIGTTSWDFNWDTTTVDDGIYTISARSFDGLDFSKIKYIYIEVKNTISDPDSGEPEEPTGPDDLNSSNEDGDVKEPDDKSNDQGLLYELDIWGCLVLIISIIIILILIIGIIYIEKRRRNNKV
jgi:serine protease AprX